jgi:hypothetical protein
MFARTLRQNLIDQLKGAELFQTKLLPDTKAGHVFPAIRRNSVDFYYKGGNLFSFKEKGKFETHIKYASIFNFDGDYIREDYLSKIKPIASFIEGYERIKENCARYASVETNGVSNIYSRHSYVSRPSDNEVVLDIEISFRAAIGGRHQDRIDLLLFNKEEKRLRFYEAKHFSNKEIWSKTGRKPQVVEQVSRYKAQINQSSAEIIKAYTQYIQVVNDLFDLKLEPPQTLDAEVVLLIFGFDRDQLKGRFRTLLETDGSLKNIKYYAIGNEALLEIKNLWSRPRNSP